MSAMFLAIAFVLGFAARQVGLPPLVGFLAAGFTLNGLGFESGPLLVQFADLGVTLLLFWIGLKLKIETLLKPEVWAGASFHMAVTVVVFGLAIFALSTAGVHLFAGLTLATSALIAFALSFSSTVFAIKALEEKGEMQSLHGRVAIGILIMQDIIAVVFITVSTGKIPSVWALALFGLVLLRPLVFRIMDRCGHGELIPLFGLFAALVLGAEAFDLVGLKADLGALILGVLLAKHRRAGEEVVQWLLLDRVDAVAARAPVRGQDESLALARADEAQTALAVAEAATTRADVTLDAPILECVPVTAGNTFQSHVAGHRIHRSPR